MISKSGLAFLEKKVDFYFISDFPRKSFNEENLDIFKSVAVHKSVALVWAESLTEILIEKVGYAEYEQVVIVISDKNYNLRRAEALLGTRIKRVYLYNGQEFHNEDLLRLCTDLTNESNGNSEEGIKRVLNFNKEVENSPVFTCIYNNYCLIESPKNLNIACLQIKGKRASAIFVEDAENETFGKISKILPPDSNNQILLNVNKLTDENKKYLEECGLEFQKIDVTDEGNLVLALEKVDLPVLNERVWDKANFVNNSKLIKILRDEKYKDDYFAISAEVSKRIEPDLEIPNEIILRSGFQTKREDTIIHYKNEILKKKYIFINNKDAVIQQDILRMLLTAGTKQYVLVAIGTKRNYMQLVDLYEEMMEKTFYQSRKLIFQILSPTELVKYLKDNIVEPIVQKVDEDKKGKVTEEEIKERKKMLLQLEKQFRTSFSKFIGNIIGDFMQLSSVIVVSDKDSELIITNAILKQYKDFKKISDVFKNKEEKKEFHNFIKAITPESSKTEFPENTEELVLIIKALIFKILGSFFNDKGNIDFIENKIKEIQLEIPPFESMTGKIKKAAKYNSTMIQEVNDINFSKYLKALKIKCKELETSLTELVLQFNFALLAVPDELISKRYFNHKELRNKSLRDKKSPFKDLELIIKELDFLLNKYK